VRTIAFVVFFAFCISAAQALSPDEMRLKKCQGTGTTCIIRCNDDAACENLCRDDYAICKAGGGSPYKTATFIQSLKSQQYPSPPKPLERVVDQKASEPASSQEPHKYRPSLTPRQIAHPSNWYEQYEVALSAFDADLVAIARARNKDATKTLDWLVRAQQQRDVNNINRTKPLIYPVR
jgi:hypothetical protein